ncbi:Major allergen Mal d 1 [Quillaja saponaria]|uniref:Major allergen Mal d 1 n=1 Tax=Quillaja saponaria TaxID=32244 RepID=A0AAD7PHJ2_QUISA|nr:Major allergen Mal d 1 [Quillaja saponaria]
MGVFAFEHENTAVIPSARLFKALILEGNNLFTKVAPQVIKSIEVIEGDGGVGSIKNVIFCDVINEAKFVPSPDGGSIVKNKSKFITKGDAEITEEEANSGNERTAGILKLFEAYLIANPDAYN